MGVNTKQLVLLAYNGQVANPNARIAAFGCGADEDTPFFLFPLQFEEEHHDPLSLDGESWVLLIFFFY